MERKDIFALSREIRMSLVNLSRQALSCAERKEFPGDGKEIKATLANLENETFDVVVCGEIKKGKSSFINAIIGDAILPVDTKVATSQAFRIVNSNQHKCYVVYVDGTKQEIDKEKLCDYGSQATIDKNGEPIIFDKIVDYMEVHTPITFLPKSVVLVDTPGLGAIYANHKVVTERHLVKANAVIFVIDPQNPITQPEIDFLKKITDITPNVLFVMTKTDCYDESYIEAQVNRDIEILKANGIDDKISSSSIQILPMSSSNLMDAVGDDVDADLYEISCFNAVEEELLKLLVATVALSKNGAAYNKLKDYNSEVMSEVADIEQILRSPDESKRLLAEREQIRSKFQALWGQNGNERKKILADTSTIIDSFYVRASNLFNPGTDVYNSLLADIESLSDYKEGERFASRMPEKMLTEYMQAWRGLVDDCSEKIKTMMTRAHEMMAEERIQAINICLDGDYTLPAYKAPQLSLMEHFNNTKGAFFSLAFIGITTWIPYLAALSIAAIWGWFNTKRAKLEKCKAKLKEYLNSNIANLRNQVLVNPIDKDNPMSKNLLQTTKDEFFKMVQSALKEIYDDQLKTCNEDVERVNERITQRNKQRDELVAQVTTIKSEWLPVHTRLNDVCTELTDLEKLLKEAGVIRG